MKTDWLLLDGARLEYARWEGGDGTALPILLLHEGLGSIRLWKQFPEALAQATGREVIAWSRFGHGWSGGGEIAHHQDYMHREAELLPALHAALGIERAHWLGHSDGGSIALIGAARHPNVCAGLILQAPHVFVEELTASSIAKLAAGFATSDMGERMKRYHAEPSKLFERWSRIWLDPSFMDWNIEHLLPQIAAPALLIQGLDDEYGTLEQLDSISRHNSNALRLELEACGHSPHFDREYAVIGAICAFLDRKD